MGSSKLNKYIITSNQELSPDVYLISFKRQFDFLPGQVLKIALDLHNPPRIYSICSGNRDTDVSVLFNVKKNGLLSPQLAKLIPGDTIYASDPYGSFLSDRKPAWWIAAGTGIAPFISMYRSGHINNTTLIHGVSLLNQFYFEDELRRSFSDNYIRCCSRETSGDTFFGRVTAYLSQLDILPDVNYYICGKALMVVEVRDLLIARGVSYEKIIAEIYF